MSPKLADCYRSTLGQAAISAVLAWASLPPLAWWPLAWIAPLWWILLIRRGQLPGRRPYAVLWLASFGFWMAALHWLRLPYWATCLGWVALSGYLAFYLPAFVWLTRVAVHRCRLSVVIAAPLVWTGLELARAHLLTGFRMASLSHSQCDWIGLIQISDLAGAYAVDFLLLLVAACAARMLPLEGMPAVRWPLIPAVAVLCATLAYGHVRTLGVVTTPGGRVALIQGSIDIEVKSDDSMRGLIHKQYMDLSAQARHQYGQLDLIVWPETMFRDPLVVFEADARAPRSWQGSQEGFQKALHNAAELSRRMLSLTAQALGTVSILGVETQSFHGDEASRFNSAVWLDRSGEIRGRYDKMHPVMFGEYIPFIRHFPRLAAMLPLDLTLESGRGPATFTVGPMRISPNICYENVLSHLVRGQIQTLAQRGEEPNVLVNLTNDGWFWGSSELDMHLACGVFLAAECRKPLLIAANTGFSAWIDADGRVRAKGPRRDTGTCLAEVEIDSRRSLYLRWGDAPAGVCLGGCLVLAIVGILRRRATSP